MIWVFVIGYFIVSIVILGMFLDDLTDLSIGMRIFVSFLVFLFWPLILLVLFGTF